MRKSNKPKKKTNKERQARKVKRDVATTLKGRLDITRSGRGFVAVDGLEEDVMIAYDGLGDAMDGDIVRVKLASTYDGRPKGKITEVVQRKRTEFIGSVQMSKGFAFVLGNREKNIPDLYVADENLNGAKNGETVVARVLDWGSNGKKPSAAIVSKLSGEDAADEAMKTIMIENGFPLSFSDDAVEIAARIPETITKEDIKLRKDVRGVLTFTIDPADAKDFDDAISYRKLKNGNHEIGVHIADVSHYVTPGNALDNEAYQKATSVYLPDRVNPMLPEHISNVLCSLRPDMIG